MQPEKGEAVDTVLGIVISDLTVAGEHAWRKNDGAILVQMGAQIALSISASGEVMDAGGERLGKAVSLPERK
jgi:hypothetical protein